MQRRRANGRATSLPKRDCISAGDGRTACRGPLTFEPDATIEEFDRRHPDGADYVIVPAVHDPSHRVLNQWLRKQAASGATLVGVCDGVLVLASAGVLEGRRATGHWYCLGRLAKKHAGTEWVRDRRYVADGNVVTTTGVSASLPVSLALVEAIGGADHAEALAKTLRVEDWGPEHDRSAYGITTRHVLTAVSNMAAFWRRRTSGIEVASGAEVMTLALVADAWARTHRSPVISIAPDDAPVVTRSGLRLVPDAIQGEVRPRRMITTPADLTAGEALDHALAEIADVFGGGTAAYVALQLEYPWTAGR